MIDLLTIPIIEDPAILTAEDIERELDNNLRSALGYVVRWIDAGIGCSKVPAITGTNLFEDRATCRLSTQHVANWLHHDIITTDQVESSMRKVAIAIDTQNTADTHYRSLAAENFTGPAFRAVHDLIFDGANRPAGYTESVLHRWRRHRKTER